jgi:2,4-dienoyl-CoA reductase-like NADH-dependent reductase (Old Yellow Enzyme family)/thioredoxin reductase
VTDRYPLCAAPIEIGGVRFRNRITRAAHGTGYGVGGKVTERLIAYHEARARGGAGSVFTETSGVHWSSPGPLWAMDDEILPGWAELAVRLHALEETRVLPQLWHGGAQAPPPDGSAAWAASAIADPVNGRTTQAMTKAMIDEVVEGFAAAAGRAQRAGLDGVEVHGAHTYLVSSFLSPLTNRREDDYGGPVENRVRFARETLAAIRSVITPPFAVGIRIVGSEGVAGGIEPDEAIRIRELLEQDGLVDFVSVSMGGYHNFGKLIGAMHEPHGYELPTSGPVASGAGVPTMVTGRVMTMAEAEAILRDGTADMVSLVRAMLADPELPAKSWAGNERDVRPCIGCNEGCVGHRMASGGAGGVTGCTVNPGAGHELDERPLERVSVARTILVAGAGPAGLEAARTAALRGHRVVVHEAAHAPGGLVRFSRRAPYRDDIGLICDWLWEELARLGVERELGSRVDVDTVRAINADAVIVATGSLPRRDGVQRLRPALHVEGLQQPNVVTPLEVLGQPHETAPRPARAVVFDDLGNYQAVGSAEKLLEAGAEVVLATSFASLAPDLVRSFQRDAVAERLGRYGGFRLETRTSVERVTPRSVTLRNVDTDRETEVESDLLVLMTGFTPQTALGNELAAEGIETHVVGDAIAPLLMPYAFTTGRAAGAAV